jgi:hypothetical protein
MTSRTYKFGKHVCKAYKKPVGKGWEVGFSFAGKPVFTGNFLHAKEANAWWTKMNQEMRSFFGRYALPPKGPKAFYGRFITNHLYNSYYNFLDRQFTKYQKGFTQALKKDQRHYTHMRKTQAKTWQHMPSRRAA